MDQSEALKAARKRWGKKALIRDNGKPSDQAARDKALADFRELKALPLPEDQTQRRARRKDLDRLCGLMHYHRFDVGRLMSVGHFAAFHVIGYGDNWAEAFRKADESIHK